MAKIKNVRTKPEMFIRSSLHRLGLRFRVNCVAIPGKPDLFFSRSKVAVFIHGCYWHRHPGCKFAYTPKSNKDFWITKLEGNLKHDEEVVKQLSDYGIRTLIIWECTVKQMMKNEEKKIEILKETIDFIKSNTGSILNL